MDEEFIRNRITELRLKKGASEYQMSLALGQNRSYIQGISSGRSLSLQTHREKSNGNPLSPTGWRDNPAPVCSVSRPAKGNRQEVY